ncbi:hypothetical protein BDK51DRAFT_29111 [Blyttiomyces helicus]|uniref:Uncharacterized protein n=1 Tax=Blyttiomyces helicus TaxID=388810 RepID=A0A4P9WM51_9FUNG|nr:hypothetical protein BDK51DRAFT_29111 [Blyttiomyces helicus]|eukprot:RKO94141.1 hypothetical protein BDK51DRAFT_29111 [Blyttiomyces helicus]
MTSYGKGEAVLVLQQERHDSGQEDVAAVKEKDSRGRGRLFGLWDSSRCMKLYGFLTEVRPLSESVTAPKAAESTSCELALSNPQFITLTLGDSSVKSPTVKLYQVIGIYMTIFFGKGVEVLLLSWAASCYNSSGYVGIFLQWEQRKP